MVERVLIVATGPSMKRPMQAPLGVYTIVVNAAIRHVVNPDAFFTLDPSLVNREILRGASSDPSVHYCAAVPPDYGRSDARVIAHREPREARVTFFERVIAEGSLAEAPGKINTGNSAYGALGLAYHWRPSRIALLGVDGAGAYGFGIEGAPRGLLNHLPALFASAMPQLNARGIEVRNGSPDSRVDCFPRCTQNEALAWLVG